MSVYTDEDAKAEVMDLCDGNPGAISVLMQTYQAIGVDEFVFFAKGLRSNSIRGSAIWCSYKDDHGENIPAFVAANTIPITDRKGLVADMKSKG